MEEKDFKFSDLTNIDAYCCVLGLSFPESANDFQKSALCLAHLMAACRESVLKGVEIPVTICEFILDLASMLDFNRESQK